MSEQQPWNPGPPPSPVPADETVADPAPADHPAPDATSAHQPAPAPWHPYPAPAVAPPNHPRATAALTLGIVAVCGLVVGLTLALGPLAWYYGATAVRDIDREPGRWGGRGNAKAGLVLGVIASGLLLLALLVLAVAAGGIALVNGFDSGYPQ